MFIPFFSAVGLVALVILALRFRGLFGLRGKVVAGFEQLHVQIRFRHEALGKVFDLIKPEIAAEKETLRTIMEVTSSAVFVERRLWGRFLSVEQMRELERAESKLSWGVMCLEGLLTSYPALLSQPPVASNWGELKSVNARLTSMVDSYNFWVDSYNRKVRRFPEVLYARLLGFRPVLLFKLEAESLTGED